MMFCSLSRCTNFFKLPYCLLLSLLSNFGLLSLALATTSDSNEFECLLEAHSVVNVSSPVAGVLDKVIPERGDSVRKGKVIAKLKSGVQRAALDLARERAAFGKRKVLRNKELIAKELISPNESDELETESYLAALEVVQAEEVLNQMTILSPINGVVVDRYFSAGEFVQVDPIVKIAQVNPLNVEVIVPVEKYGSIHKGMRAIVKLQEPVGGEYEAKVIIVDSMVDAASGTIGVRLELPNPRYEIPAGLKCFVVFPAK